MIYKRSNVSKVVVLIIAAFMPTQCVHPKTLIKDVPTMTAIGNDQRVEWPKIDSAISSNPQIEKRVESILEKMSLDQKIGQMIQIEIGHATPEDITNYYIGSVLNGGGSIPDNDKNASVDQWVALADSFWKASMETSTAQIPIMWGTDAVHGHNNVQGATIFPHNIGLGAANDPNLVKRIGEITAKEVSVTGIDWTFAPVVAVVRDDRWGRTYESYSEDIQIVKAYASKMIEGLQGNLNQYQILATAKHFLGDGGTQKGDDQGDNISSEKEMRDIHAQGFFAALGAGVQTVMVSLSSWKGKKLHEQKYLLTDVLKNKLGFDGLIVSDWNGIGQVEGCTNSNCAKAVTAGIDMFMIPYPKEWKLFIENVKNQVANGEIPLSRIDDAVSRILRVKIRAGLFDIPMPSKRLLANKKELLGSTDHRKVAREAVRKSLVLLKNRDNILPLKRDQKILVAGKSANSIQNQTGGWTLTWQGNSNKNNDFVGATSILNAIEKVAPSVLFDESGDLADKNKHDVAIVVIGETPYAEMHGDLGASSTLEHARLCPYDLEVLEKIKKAGIPIVTIFISGRPLYVNKELNTSNAFVAAWLPGSEGGGITDVIFENEDKKINFDFVGKLSFSWPKAACQTRVNRGDKNYEPLFPYGYGLTYSQKDNLTDDLPLDSRVLGCGGKNQLRKIANEPLDIFVEKRSEKWNIRIGDPNDWNGIFVDEKNNKIPNMIVKPQDDRNGVQWGALNIEFIGEGYLGFQEKLDSRMDLFDYHSNNFSMVFDVMINQKPTSNVNVRIDCGYPCGSEIDITKKLINLEMHKWHKLSVPLREFSATDFTKVDTPFLLYSQGSMNLSIANVRWAK